MSAIIVNRDDVSFQRWTRSWKAWQLVESFGFEEYHTASRCLRHWVTYWVNNSCVVVGEDNCSIESEYKK